MYASAALIYWGTCICQVQVFVVAHDWGAVIAWFLCLYRPDRVKAYVGLSVHFNPRNPKMKPIETMRKFFGDDHYMVRFQVLSSPSLK